MRTKKALLNLISNLVLQIISVIIGFILPRFFITTYGSSINGLIVSIKQFLSYLKIVEAGVGNASVAALYKPLLKNEKDKINGILSATNYFYRRSGYFFIVLVIILSIYFPIIASREVDTYTAFYLVLILGISGIIEYFSLGKYRVLLTADQKSYIIFYIQSALNITSAIISVLLINMGYSVIIVIATSTTITVSNVLILREYIKKSYPFFNIRVKPDTISIKSKWDALIHQIAGLVVFNTPIIIITIFSGLSEVSVYIVYNMVFNAVILLISSFSSAMQAAFGDLIVRDDKAVLQRYFNNFEYLFYAVAAVFYTCTSLLILPFIEVYTFDFDDANYTRPLLAVLFILAGIANTIRIPSSILINSAGHFKETKYRAIIEALINIIASLIFVKFMGVEGVLLGSLCSYAYRTADQILYTAKYILKVSAMQTFIKLFRNTILSIIATIPFVTIINIEVNHFLEWLIWASLTGIWACFVVILGNTMFDRKSMLEIWKQIKSTISKGN
jgi:O-antigen/teichoic acid export membrane protein